MYIEREIYKQIKRFLPRREIVAVVGPRQTGKTTLLAKIKDDLIHNGKRVAFYTFENRNERDLFDTDIDSFVKENRGVDVIIIDEFQYATDGGQKLKLLYDTTQFKFIISGSSSLELRFQTGKYLVGRLLTFELLPFSFREFLSAAEPQLYNVLSVHKSVLCDPASQPVGAVMAERLRQAWENYACWGGYPAATLTNNDSDRSIILSRLFDTYIDKDIRSLLQLATEREMTTLFQLLAAQIGSLVNYRELSGSSSLNFPQLKRHLNILKETYIIELVRPYFRNRRQEITKAPKVYFYDMGLRNAGMRNFLPLKFRDDIGHLAENVVFGALRRQELPAIHFWRSKSDAEVDFVYEQGGQLCPVEVKYVNNPVVGKSLHAFIERYNPTQVIIATKNIWAEDKIGECKIFFRPAFYL